MTNKASFASAEKWIEEAKKYVDENTAFAICGNKADVGIERSVTFEEARAYAISKNASYFETSMMTNEASIGELFEAVAKLGINASENKPPIRMDMKSVSPTVTAFSLSSEARAILEQQLLKGGESELNRAKIMTAGPGRAGKSATIRSLTGKDFDPNLESTIGADASQTCQVNRTENVVNWTEKEKEGGEFAAHIAHLINEQLKLQQNAGLLASASAPASKERRPSILQKIRNSFSSKSVSQDANAAAASTAVNVLEAGAVNDVPTVPKGTFSLKDDQEAMGFYNMDIIAKAVKDQESSTNIALSIWDLGGQEVFYTLHHLFLSKFAVYICIFNMQHMIDEDKAVRMKSMEYTNFWLRSIQMHAKGAPIFLVGTFKDKVPDPKQHKKINEYLCLELKVNTIAPTLVRNNDSKLVFWPIDNSKGVQGDPVIQHLRSEIMDVVCKMEHIKMKIPIAWTRIYDKLMETKKRNMSLHEVIEISKTYGIDDESHVTSMLSMFHQLGMILHFNKTNELRDLVILDPQWLVDALTMVIRDFELHSYDDDLTSDLIMDFADDYMKLKNDSIASVTLLYRLWKSEDGESDIDYTRRKFLVSIMEQMTLSSPWRFGEDFTALNDSGEDGFMPTLPPPTQYIIPSNLRLSRGEEIEKSMREKIDEEVLLPVFEKITNPTTSNCFVIDFTQSFLPIGFFDRLICLLVAYSSACFEESRTPIVANSTVLMSFGMHDFRVDEDLQRSRITVVAAKKCDQQLILNTVESMVGKLKDEVMGSLLKYRVLIAIWREEGKKCCLVEIDKAREAVSKNKSTIRDINEKPVEKNEFEKVWVVSSSEIEALDHIKQVTQRMVDGKTHHVFFLHADKSASSVSKISDEIAKYGVKSLKNMDSMNDVVIGIKMSSCVCIYLVDDVFDDPKVQASILQIISMVKENKTTRIPIMLLQEGRESISHGEENPIIATASADIRRFLENVDQPIFVKHRMHERVQFYKELCAKIHKICINTLNTAMEASMNGNSLKYLAFWSHFKAEAGITARLLHEKIELRCKSRQDENPTLLSNAKTFIDSDDLKDLRSLLDSVKKSHKIVVILTKKYLTRPWCLAELYAALENNIPIVPLNVIGGGYDFNEAKQFMETLTAESLNQASTAGDAATILIGLGIDIPSFGKKLASVLPNIISISFNPLGGGRVMEAEIDTIIDKLLE